jgi:hypothetical protein
MKVRNKFMKFQDGGAAPAPQDQGGAPQDQGQRQAPEEGQEQDPMAQILQVAAQAVQKQDCQAALAVCQALMQLAQGVGGQEQAPQEPTFARKGAKLVRVK